MDRREAIDRRVLSRVGDVAQDSAKTEAEASGLFAVLGSTVGLMFLGSALGLWLVTR